MDIWQWVQDAEDNARENGNYRLAEIIETLPGFVVNDEYAKVDALVPEGINLARQENNKWLEIFFRHWNLQSRVLNRNQVKGMLPETISLVDFCHQEETRDCPQSICVVQDLAQCYENIDDTGYAEDRLAVATETLERIDPHWPCFECIGSEYISALMDMGKSQKALDWLIDARKNAKAVHAAEHKTLFQLSEISALIALKRLEDALACSQKADNPYGGDGFVRSNKNYLALILSLLGKFDQALEQLMPFDEIKEGCEYFPKWSEATCLLVEAGKIENDWTVDSQLDYMAEKLFAQGVIRHSIRISHRQARLALLRERPLTVQRCITRIESLLPQLNKELGAADELQQLTEQFNALEKQAPQYTFSDSESVLDSLDDDIELNALKLNQGLAGFPNDENLVLEMAQTLQRMHRIGEADTLLAEFLARFPDASRSMLRYGFSLLDQSDDKTLDSLLGTKPPENLPEDYLLNWHWLQACYADKKQDKQSVQKYLQQCLSISPMAYNCLKWLAELSCELEDYQTSIELWDRVINNFDDEKHCHWDRMIPATLLNQWDLVIESIGELELSYAETDLKPNTPIDLELEIIHLQIEDSDGDKNNYRARRTGPVTARIISVSSPYNETQLYNNEYVFYPAPLNKLEQTDDEGHSCDSEGYYTHLFPAIKNTRQANYASFYIDGFFPGDELWNSFEQQLSQFNGMIEIRSGDEYELSFEEENHPAIYVFIAIPEADDYMALAKLLDETFAHLSKPLIWPGLHDLTANEKAAEEHRKLEELYDM